MFDSKPGCVSSVCLSCRQCIYGFAKSLSKQIVHHQISNIWVKRLKVLFKSGFCYLLSFFCKCNQRLNWENICRHEMALMSVARLGNFSQTLLCYFLFCWNLSAFKKLKDFISLKRFSEVSSVFHAFSLIHSRSSSCLKLLLLRLHDVICENPSTPSKILDKIPKISQLKFKTFVDHNLIRLKIPNIPHLLFSNFPSEWKKFVCKLSEIWFFHTKKLHSVVGGKKLIEFNPQHFLCSELPAVYQTAGV